MQTMCRSRTPIVGISSAVTSWLLLLGGVSSSLRQMQAVDLAVEVPPISQGAGKGRPGADGVVDRGGDGQRQSSPRSPSLPQCYSSTAADPSQGTWRKCEGGVAECSPVKNIETWANVDVLPPHYRVCGPRWESEHQGEGLMPYYEWEPSACNLEKVDAEGFCRVVTGRKGLLFVGDSLSKEMTETLAAILRADVLEKDSLLFRKYTGCQGRFKFTFLRNDFLDARTTEFPTGHHCEQLSEFCVVFADDSILSEYDTLVVNAGAHRRTGGIEAYGEMMRNTSAVLSASMKRLHGDDAILVVRNTVPGHWDSYEKTFDGPVDAATAQVLLDEVPNQYGWQDFPAKNKILEDAFPSTDGWALLDAYTPTIMRTDMHGHEGDGLHYCIPGPVDHWVRMLYNMLLVDIAMKGGN